MEQLQCQQKVNGYRIRRLKIFQVLHMEEKFLKIYSGFPILFLNFLQDFGVLSLVIFGRILSM